MRTLARTLGFGLALTVSACLVQASSQVPPWCPPKQAHLTALSSDGRWILAGGEATGTITLFDRALLAVRQYPTTTLDGQLQSTVAAIYDVPARQSFVVSLPGIGELWEVSYDPKAEPIFDGLVHDYRMGEGLAQAGYLGVRRTRLQQPLHALYFTLDGRNAIGLTAVADGTPSQRAHVVNLDVRREIALVLLSDKPDPAENLLLKRGQSTWWAIPGSRQSAQDRAKLLGYCTP